MRKILGFFLLTILLAVFASCSEEKIIENNQAVLVNENNDGSIIIESISGDISENISSDIPESSEPVSSSVSSAPVKSEISSRSSSVSSVSSSPQPSYVSESTAESSQKETFSESVSASESKVQDNLTPSAAGEVRAVWISYLEYDEILNGKSQSAFTAEIRSMLGSLKNDGYNTVFVHARSHCDAYYKSSLFPWSRHITGTEGKDPGFDPLAIIISEAHSLGIRVDAWINPYRIEGKSSDYTKIASNSPAMKWVNTDKVCVIDNGIFFNPADDEVIDLIVDGVREIVSSYNVDGIHFDDYFYPTTSDKIDSSYYSAYLSGGGTLKLDDWRRENVNKLIRKTYSAIKAIDSTCYFGVSPSGNMEGNYQVNYCDIAKWVSNPGYVDYICPQIYWGFEHTKKPYKSVLDEFSSMIKQSGIDLYVGLAAYKTGTKDNNNTEWIDNTDILKREVLSARSAPHYAGFAIYRYDSLYKPAASVKSYALAERDNLKEIM